MGLMAIAANGQAVLDAQGRAQEGRKRRLLQGLPVEEVERILVGAARDRGVESRTLSFYLHDMDARGVHQLLGFSSAVQFARVRLDMSRRKARELLATGRALHELEQVDKAFAEGRISWTKARLLARIAVPGTEAEWLERALELTSKELEREVAGSEKGRPPRKDGKGLPEVRFKVTVKLGALAHETWRQALALLQAEAGEELSEDVALQQMAERVLRGGGSEAGARGSGVDDSLFRLVVDHDPVEGRTTLRTAEGSVPLSEPLAAMVACDGQVVRGQDATGADGTQDLRLPGGLDQPTPRALRKRVLARDGFRCRCCEGRNQLTVHHVIFRSRGGKTKAENLVSLCMRCHALVHEGLLRIEGRAPHDLRYLDREGRSVLEQREVLRQEGLLLERRPAAAAGEGGARAPRWGAGQVISLANLPRRVDADWWRRHRHLLRWNERRGLLQLTPGSAREPEAPRERDAEGAEEHSPGTRPASLAAVVGQQRTVKGLQIAVEAARRQDCAVGHVLLAGPPGLGKTTLAQAVAREMGTRVQVSCAGALEDPSVLLGLLAGLGERDVVFLDEIHALPRRLAELLYEALEDGQLSLPVTDGEDTRTVTIGLPAFTLIGATTDPDRMPRPLRDRFCMQKEVEHYSEAELMRILEAGAQRRGVLLDQEAAGAIARASRGTPRVALRLLAQAHDLVVARARHLIGAGEVQEALELEGLDARGLCTTQRRALSHLASAGRPVGSRRLAAALGLALRTFRQVVEPDLLRLGLVTVTPRGLAVARCSA